MLETRCRVRSARAPAACISFVCWGQTTAMKITCPSCNTSYAVNAETFPADGRNVRCARCRSVWHAVAYLPEADILPPEREGQAEPAPAIAKAQPSEAPDPDPADPAKAETAPETAPEMAVTNVARPSSPASPKAPATGARLMDTGPEGEAAGMTAEDAPPVPAHLAAHRAARRAARTPRIRVKSSGNRGLTAFLVGVAIAVAVAAVQFREDVVRSLPSTAGLYALAGLPVNLRGLEFSGITQRRDFDDGLPVLIVEGEIHNLEAASLPVPALRFSLRGQGGSEIYAWTIEPRQKIIEAGASMTFRTRLASPPRNADDMLIRFIDRRRQTVGLAPG